ncbi:hypothetical protein WR25_01064 [Diploscapter pachys]|uniref:protein-tyrosine-phosphatase n=1 Tax=Diploscapter pachys TaxID=2018661 RepID=A0A2A2JT61_9BILA|nr:hypothetical protein WR25_01064 [Diploscapter pachys]
MVSNATTYASTSFQPDEGIDGGELDRVLRDDFNHHLCVLDCRTEGDSLKGASRVRLPNVLSRRLHQGSLALSNVSPRLQDPSIQVVIIPGANQADQSTSDALVNALRKEAFDFRILTEPVDRVLARFPTLRIDERKMSSEPSNNISCLNLNALRIEPEESSRADKKTIFPVQILPYLYLGNAETAQNADLLEKHNIHHIINVTSNLPNALETNPKFHYLRISVDDNSTHNLIQFFPEAISFIESARLANDGCLVHCLAGISRSVTVCLAYLMTTNRWSLEDAYDLVQHCNASIAPNFHFMGQLTDYERHLGLRSQGQGTYSAPRSPFCSAQAAVTNDTTSSLLTPPPTSCSASPQSSNSSKSFH